MQELKHTHTFTDTETNGQASKYVRKQEAFPVSDCESACARTSKFFKGNIGITRLQSVLAEQLLAIV